MTEVALLKFPSLDKEFIADKETAVEFVKLYDEVTMDVTTLDDLDN